ncbi:hypothetical protein CDD83_2262 [Cordyceps sp. RAO-2017]|nr:hypothetical protein CDD83_2262 [Cordyceps sp. RAO-2017]
MAALLARVHDLSDLELALLLCLVSREHGLLSTPAEAIDDLVRELQLVAGRTFGLRCVVVDCAPDTTLEQFASALLCPSAATPNSPPPPPRASSSSYFVADPQQQRQEWRSNLSSSSHQQPPPPPAAASLRIANCVLAKNLDRAPRVVQIQALELLRTRRIFTRTSVQAAPKQFVFAPVLAARSGGSARVTTHLNDFFALAHWHDPDDGFVHLEGRDETDSVVRGGRLDDDDDDDDGPAAAPLISEADISQLAQLSQKVDVDVDVLRYQMNIISFLRMHRAVAHGMTPAATKHMDKIVRCLAPIHGLDYVTPALVGLAARKVYLHRILVTAPDKERSLQWGSRLEAVQAVLHNVGPEDIIDDVLDTVTAPL